MDNMKDIVSSVIGKLSLGQVYDHDKLQNLWGNMLNNLEKQHTKIIGLNEGNLTVHVDSPAWLYQMKIKRVMLTKRLKQEDFDIKSIFFKIGKVK